MTNVTQEDFINMMREFKNTIENTIEISVNNVGKKINDNIEEKLQKNYLNMKKLSDDVTEVDRKVKESDDKNVVMNEMLKKRIEILEMNNKKMNFKNMKSDTLLKSQPDSRSSLTKRTTEETQIIDESNKKTSDKKDDTNPPMIQKQKSWSEEVEETWKLKNCEEAKLDKQQWLNERRIPNNWTDEVELLVVGNDALDDNILKKQHKNMIDKEARNHVKNWFGYDDDYTEDESSDEDAEEDKGEDWKKIERKKKKSKKKKKKKKEKED